MRTLNTVLPAAIAFLCFGCAFGRTSTGVNSTPENYLMSAGASGPSSMPRGQREVVEPVLPTLYGRDGSPVAVQRGGTVDPERRSTHELDSADGSRMYILELYQQAIDEKESLRMEVEALSSALDKANDAIEQDALRIGELQKMSEELRAQVMTLQADGDDLAARLTTAQIRRLESEKMLLEAKLEWSRLQKMMARRSASAEAAARRGDER